MPRQEEINQYLFLDHTQPPRRLSAGEVERFLDLCRRLNYLAVEAVKPIDPPEQSVAKLLRITEMGVVRIGRGAVAGPYVIAQNSSSAYYPDGIMIYERPS